MRKDREPLPRGFASLWLTVVIDLLGFGIALPLLPLYVKNDLGASAFVVGIVLAAYSAAQLVGAPVLGKLSDRYGRRPVLVISLIGSAVGHLLTGLASSVALIIFARAFDGFSGGSLSIAHAAAADLAPPAQRPRLFGLLGAWIALGFVAGPALGSLAALGGHRLPFFLAAALAGVNALTAWWRLPALPPVAASRAGGVHDAVPRPAAGPDGAGSDGARSGLTAAPVSSWRLLAPSGLLGRLLVSVLLVGIGFSGFEATFVLLGEDRVGLNEHSAGLVFAGVGVVLSVVQAVLVKKVIGKLGATRTARVSVLVTMSGFLLLAPALGWIGLAPALVARTVGQGLLNPAMSTIVSTVTADDRRGQVFGVQQAVGSASRILGPLVATGLFALAVPLPYLVGAVLAVIGALSLLTVPVDAAAAGPTPARSGH
ncbi:MAG: MFS transporter [Acidimicrobiales bacterium]|nr:MFS transporter [Acidimicrobiales bacterium]